jgi:hypothetical protein
MARTIGWLDRTLGRLVFRAVWLVCALVALICAYAAWSHIADWRDYSLVPTILFGLAAVAAGSAVPYCFSRRRTFAEALDAMEGGAGDTRKWDKNS